MAEVAALEAEVKEFKLQLETVQSSLQVDPDNAELQGLKTELEEFISLTEQSIAELKPAAAPAPQPSPKPVKEKWSKENHPAYQAGYRKPAVEPSAEETPQQPASFSVNDNVLARWVSGDNAFYPARITAITGSATNPIYMVSFKSYSTTETLRGKDIKPISSTTNNASADSRKRKADGNMNMPGSTGGGSASSTPLLSPSSAASSSASNNPTAANTGVISAAADINMALANEARKEPSKATDGPTRPSKMQRKVKANKELERGKSKWQDFTAKGKLGKAAKKESMFRTPEGINARVGFTGSGQTMRKDPTRSRHVYQQGEEEY